METKKNAALVYNTLNGQYLEYRDNTKISRLIRRLNSDSNLYVIKLEGKEMDESVSHFIEELRAAFCGDIINTAHRPHKPRQLKPMINLHTSFETREGAWEKENLLAKDEIGDYLNILTLYLNEKCVQNCTLCGKADKQFQWCRSGKRGNMLSLEDIQAVMAQINTARLTRVHISGGNWFEYPELPELTALLGTIKADKFYVSHYLNLPDAQSCNILDMLKTRNNKMEISVHFPLDIKALEASLQWTGEIPARYRFAVESEAHLKQLENLASRYAFDDIIISPYYNGSNASFFESSVYSSKEDIIEDRPTMKEILARQVLNTSYFKRLIISCDKKIRTNPNRAACGVLGKGHIADALFKELNHGQSWTRLRKNVNPCKSCVYHALCPPISNYEHVLDKNNLCHVK